MRHLLIGTAIAAALVVGGCDQKPEKKTEHVTVSDNGGKITVETPDGHTKVQIATGGDHIAATMPSFVSLYPDAKVQSHMQGASEGGKGGGVIYTAKAAPDAIIAFYRDMAKKEGMRETMNMQSNNAHILIATAEDSQHSFHVSASPAGDGSEVSVFWSGE